MCFNFSRFSLDRIELDLKSQWPVCRNKWRKENQFETKNQQQRHSQLSTDLVMWIYSDSNTTEKLGVRKKNALTWPKKIDQSHLSKIEYIMRVAESTATAN